MAKLDVVKVFLASPGDVLKERSYVEEVIAHLNRSVALNYGIYLKLFLSDGAMPGFGGGGQSVINKQAGSMKTYELFLCVLWSKIGSPTRRAKSGTVEEFKRAERAFNQYGNPDIWIYFRDTPILAKTQADLDQKGEVLKFREEVRTKGFLKEYKTVTKFKEMLREHLINWIHSRSRKPMVTSRTSRTRVGTLTKAPPKRAPQEKPPVKKGGRTTTVTEPSKLVMLDNKFYQAQKISTQAGQKMVLHLDTNRLEQEELRLLRPEQPYQKKQVNFADKVDAGLVTVESVDFETTQGKTVATVSLTVLQSPNQNNLLAEFNTLTHSADDIAESRAQRVLLGQELPQEIRSFGMSSYTHNSYTSTVKRPVSTLPELWLELKTTSQAFLPKAWLFAAYVLKTEGIVESIQILELGPVQKKQMHVKFRGQRRKTYSNRDPATISFEGECALDS